MNTKVKQKFETLEELRKYLYDLTQDLSEEELNINFEFGRWSIAQLFYHLYMVDKATFETVTNRMKLQVDHHKSGIKEKLRMKVLKFLLRMPIKYKAPKQVSHSIPEEVEVHKLKEDWINVRQGWQLLLNVQNDEQLRYTIFKHPAIGPIDLVQTLDFIKAHHKHHLPQVKRLLSKIER